MEMGFLKSTLKALKNRLKPYWINFTDLLEIYRELDYPKSKILLCNKIRIGSCSKEPGTVRWIESFQKGDTVFDIGANVGTYSLIMALYAKDVLAIEPSVTNYNLLCKNLILNVRQETIPNVVTPLNLALSDSTGMKRFDYFRIKPGFSGHRVEGVMNGIERSFIPQYSQQVMCYRLDDLLKSFNIPVPNHIKIDVDGAELEVVKGADSTLSSPQIKSLLVEISDESSLAFRKKELINFLSRKGFKMRDKFKVSTGEECYNYLFDCQS